MTKKVRASTRNWQKARLIGFNLDEYVLTDEEKDLYYEIRKIKRKLLDRWDFNTPIINSQPIET